jgi:hypothetical protein
MLERFRKFWTNVFKPIAHLLIRLGVSPDTVTLVGTIGVVARQRGGGQRPATCHACQIIGVR